ncbi:MAG: FtsQ-type POTRA domain-containing protein [Endomicrobium sp.]|jgi:cell division protein FtsQ|nr:FtsQ-type POTRA domain-containing protein [Endomicrobium sp.]
MAKKKRYVYRRVSGVSNHSNSRNKGRKSIKLFFYTALFVFFAFLIYFGGRKLMNFAYESDKIIVKDIEVVGTKNVTKTEIKELLPFKTGDNLLKINLSKAEDEIKRLKPELKNIIINRSWQKVKIKLYERTPEAFIMCGDAVFGIDFDDNPFPLRGFMSAAKVPKLFYRSDVERKKLLSFVKIFKPVCGDFLTDVSEIKFSNAGDIIFVTHDNTVVFWGDEEPDVLSHKFNRFQKIYADAMSKYKQIEYIDMTLYSFGRATVKPVRE